ncbi:MAG: sigma 54-dependent Fis family transcriptional regulator [Myxococcaceae bacterium]|nr:sigma 54-dependent Fis family transcriptional regulator [Myxococcaceae bacterium]
MRSTATEPLGSRPDGAPRRLVLHVLSGKQVGTQRELDGQPLAVGAGEANDLVLEDPAVSRAHLVITPDARGAWVRDVGSSNGTFLSGAMTREFLVESEATFSVGRTLLQLRVAAGAAATTSFGGLVTKSPKMTRTLALLKQVAAANSTVLVRGETGTGKERVARGLHAGSARATKPFVVLDCGALGAGTVESELFGHKKGAFTGAVADHRGAMAAADGGTLFIDEVGELPLELQPRLLRFIETGTLRRLGDTAYTKHDVRIVAATNRDLKAEVDAGRFRADLYFRLAVVEVELPALRDRAEDLELLVRAFVLERGRPDFPISASLMAQLNAQQWPGNVRELRNFVERALADSEVAVEPSVSRDARPFREAKDATVEAFAKEYFGSLLARTNRNVSEVARLAGVARPYLHELIKKYGL